MPPEVSTPANVNQHRADMPNSLVPATAPKATGDEVRKPGLILTPPSKRTLQRRKTVFWSVLSALVVLVVSVVCIMYFVNRDIHQAQAASDGFVHALESNHSDDAYNQTGKAFQDSTTKIQLAQLVVGMHEYTGGHTWQPAASYVGKTDAGTQAAIVYKTQNGNATFYARVILDKLQGKWQVRNFRFSQQTLEAKVQ